MNKIIEKLLSTRSLTVEEYEALIAGRTPEIQERLRIEADKLRFEAYGNKVFIRGLIEISNICKNNCYYCGIRRDNKKAVRYRLDKEEILSCCTEGYSLGFRTFVMQGGEDSYFCDELICDIVSEIREKFSDCAITLSLGEKSKKSYLSYYKAGANRYLLRHETANEAHYHKLHPA